ncbi:hypothetical protein IAR50_006680 [Cryptococcus sp. DSM 104548]
MKLALACLSGLATLSSAALLPLPAHTDTSSAVSLLDESSDQVPFGHLPSFSAIEEGGGEGEKVNVTLYVMSRCPDARLCENTFGTVLRTASIPPKINLSLQFIGSLNTSSSQPFGVECKHGPKECVGNAHQLCLTKHLKGVEDWYSAIECMNYPSDWPDKVGEVGEVERCAKTVGGWEEVEACIVGPKGEQDTNQEDGERLYLTKEATHLLRSNVRKTEESGVKTSCTIDIASTLVSGGKRRCVVDGGVWKGCDDGHMAADFVRVIEEEYKNLQSLSQATAE